MYHHCAPVAMHRPLYGLLFLLLLVFLQLCGISGSLAEQLTGVVREVPHKGQGASQAYTVSTEGRQLIRIVTSTKDLENKKRYCSEKGISVRDFVGGSLKCDTFHVLKAEDVQHLRDEILPAAVKLHADRLRVDRVEGPLVIPEFEDDSICSYFTVPVSHHCKGVENADMVLYVAVKPVGPFSIPCARAESNRPIAGALNLLFYRKYGLRYNVRNTAHEIAHALGFNYEDMANAGIVSTTTTVRSKVRPLVTFNKTVEMARKHYACGDLTGMELAYDNQNESVVTSHWAHRVAKDELMSSYTVFGAGYYTALTMSAFEGLKYYTANWGMEESMAWGNNSGCDFINGACNDYMKKTNTSMFCNTEAPRCTSDRFAVGRCTPSRGYYAKTGPDDCRFATPQHVYTSSGMLSALCTLTVDAYIPGSVTGNNSWCLDGESLVAKSKVDSKEESVGGVCARVRCKRGIVKVQYAGDTKWHDCPEGTSLNPSNTSKLFTSGQIKCPKYDEVCTMTPDGGSRLIPRSSRLNRNRQRRWSLR